MSRTVSQLKAIGVNEGNVVVTASAGSGKTSVMIDRFIRLVLDKKAEVDEILAVTFTRLAASEMKTRLAKALRENIAAGREVDYLKRQFEKLPTANISTVDSFCNTVVKRYFYVVDVDPSFSIADETTVGEIQSFVMDELFADLYERGDEDFLNLVRIFSSSRKDAQLKNIVNKLFDFVRSEKDGDEFFRRALALYTVSGVKTAENRLIALYFDRIANQTRLLENYLDSFRKSGLYKYVPFLESYLSAFNARREEGSEAALRSFFENRSKKPNKSEKDDPAEIEFSEFFTKTFNDDRLKKIKKSFYDTFYDSPELRLEKSLKAGETLRALVSLTKEFGERYAAEKTERGLLDYADLEHKTYEILQNKDALEEISGSFKYIFVDEYQDTNGVQEAIFSLLERDNLFIVGDVKQSIYGFRGSDPQIFSDRVEKGRGEKIDLAENFRSTKTVVEAVNRVFSRIMTADSGVQYAKKQMIYGDLYPNEPGYASLQFTEKDKKSKERTKGVYSVRKHLAMKRSDVTCGRHSLVRRIVEENVGASFTDRTGKRRIAGFNDILIVSRTTNYDDVVNELIRSGIPVSSEAEKSAVNYYEISLAVDILTSVYTRCRDDAALVSVLKSRIAGVDDGELLRIRRSDDKADFHEAAANYPTTHSDALAKKLTSAFSYMERLFVLSAVEGCGKLLSRVVEETSLAVDILKMPCGKIRMSRLERFIGGFLSGGDDIMLGDFMENKAPVFEKKSALISGDDSVRIMTIHKSKGLEAPIVIVIGTNYEINGNNKCEKVLKNRSLGVAVNYYDLKEKTREKTIIRRFIEEETYLQTTYEEARLMYVALTRAEIKLYVVVEGALSDSAYLDPVRLKDFFNKNDMTYVERARDELVSPTVVTQRQLLLGGADEDLVRAIERRINYSYPYENDAALSLKRTVTDVNSKERELAPAAPVVHGETDEKRGNAYHRFLELCSLDGSLVESDVSRLVEEGKLSREDADELDDDKLKRVLALGVFDMLKGRDIYREAPFIVNVPASAVGERGDGEVLLQGIVDLFAVRGDDVIIVDYKYSSKGEQALKATYKKQLDLYALAIERALGKHVSARFIVNVNTATVVEV